MLMNRWYEPKPPKPLKPTTSQVVEYEPMRIRDMAYIHETHKDWLLDARGCVAAVRYRHYVDGKLVEEHTDY